ncbi:hypothetical protein BP6252_04192 [Coleophoma cylindrospora]|uniref:BTB domain-containing protein n=1 Tax=Coleophoma cylindrospora TaxID=1849047 RepID=A0A3D8S0C9_9HELO|nr:hypothetical protein BP6252_04192 [Coleophoma cylindrospora]
MAVDLIQGDGGAGFLQSLMQSEMLELVCVDTSQREITVRIPSILACTVSKRFEELVYIKHNLNVLELLGESQASFEQRVNHDFYSLLVSFVEWLYTSSVPKACLAQHLVLWHLGHLLQAPTFQNAILRNFTIAEKSKKRSKTNAAVQFPCKILENFTSYQSMQAVLKQAKYVQAMTPGYVDDDDEEKEDFFADKELLRFLVDCLAVVGFDHPHCKQVIRGGGYLAEQMVDAANEMLMAPHGHPYPWSKDGIEDYLVEERNEAKEVRTNHLTYPDTAVKEPATEPAPWPKQEPEAKSAPWLKQEPEAKPAPWSKKGQEYKSGNFPKKENMDAEMKDTLDASRDVLSDDEGDIISPKTAMAIARPRVKRSRASSLPIHKQRNTRRSTRSKPEVDWVDKVLFLC